MKSIFLFFCTMICTVLMAQDLNDSLALKLKKDLVAYSEISTYSDQLFYLSDINYTAEQAREENIYVEEDNQIDALTVLSYLQQHIFRSIDGLLQEHSLLEMLAYGNESLSMILSDDERFLNISIDEKAGGTFQSRMSTSYYCTDEGVLLNVTSISRDGIDKIYTIPTQEGMKYLFLEFTMSCTSCSIFKAHLVHFSNSEYKSDFAYEMQLREGNYELSFNEEKGILDIVYQIDDFQSYCDCEPVKKWDDRVYIEQESDIEECTCVFEFDGSSFQLITASEKKRKE